MHLSFYKTDTFLVGSAIFTDLIVRGYSCHQESPVNPTFVSSSLPLISRRTFATNNTTPQVISNFPSHSPGFSFTCSLVISCLNAPEKSTLKTACDTITVLPPMVVLSWAAICYIWGIRLSTTRFLSLKVFNSKSPYFTMHLIQARLSLRVLTRSHRARPERDDELSAHISYIGL